MLKNFKSSSIVVFVRDSLILINSGGVAGILYMLVHVVSGRWMDQTSYAYLVALLGLLNVLGVPASAVRTVMARYVAEFSGIDSATVWVAIVKRALRRILLYGGAAVAFWVVIAPFTKDLLAVPTLSAVVVLGVIAFVRILIPVVSGALEGASRFGWLAASSVGQAAARLGIMSLVVYYTSNLAVAMMALCVSTLVGLAIGYWPFHRVLKETPPCPDLDTSPMYRYLWPVLLSQGGLHFLINLDLVFMPRFLSGDDLAGYGKVAILSRTVLYLSQPIATVMFPRVVRSKSARLFFGPLAFAFLISFVGALMLSIAPGLFMRMMYGINIPFLNSLTRMYVWAALPLSLLLLVAQYLWARSMTMQSLWVVPILGAYALAMGFFHDTPQQMIACLAAGSWVALLVLGFVARGAWKKA